MAKRRTRKEKLTARVFYHIPDLEIQPEVSVVAAGLKKTTTPETSLMGYDLGLWRRDMAKTAVLTMIILIMELVIFYYWR